jgi:hypothetical protein
MLRLHPEETMRALSALLLLGLTACQTTPAVDPDLRLRPDTRPQCERRCGELGMDLSAIVLIRNSAGCVCEARPPGAAPREAAPGAALRGGSAAVPGGALIVALEEEEARRRQSEDAHRRSSSTAHPPGSSFGRPGSSMGR